MTRNVYRAGPASDHFERVRFFNLGEPVGDRSLLEILRWRFAMGAARWPTMVPVTRARPDPRVEGLRVTMAGHATVLIQAGGVNILTDPVCSERASSYPRAVPRRVTAPGVALRNLPPRWTPC